MPDSPIFVRNFQMSSDQNPGKLTFHEILVGSGSGILMMAYYNPYMTAWRIILVSKWLGSPPFISHEKAIWKGSHNPS